MTAALTALALLAAAPAPARRDPHPVISDTNAARLRPVETRPWAASYLADGPGRGELAVVGWEARVEVIDADTFRPLRTLAGPPRPIHFATTFGRRAWCENDTRVVVTSDGGGPGFTFETGNDQPKMAFSPDGSVLATGGYGTRAKVWDAATGRAVRELGCGAAGGLWPVFSPDGRVLAVGNRNDRTCLFDAATGKPLHRLGRASSQQLAFSPDGRRLAVGYVSGEVAVWDVATGNVVEARDTGGEEVYTVAWSPAGDVLVTGGLAGKVVVWEPRELRRLAALDAPVWVNHVRFTPDGTRLLVSGAADGTGKPDRKVTVWAVER